MRRLILLLVLLVVLILVAVFGGIYFYGKSTLHENVVVEAGTYITASDFAKDPSRKVSFPDLEEGQTYGTELPGEYTVRVKSGLFSYKCRLVIVDTVPPDLDVKNVTYFGERTLLPEDFVVSATDRTTVTLSFVAQPDVTLEGQQTVKIRATDESGNETVKDATLTTIFDNDPPEIAGVRDLEVYVNETVSYKDNIVVTDALDPDADFEVDASAVNLAQTGDYPVIYTAFDHAGNRTSEEATVHVIARSYDEAQINQYAQNVLAQILNDSMTEREKLNAIYTWCRSNIGYVNNANNSDWLRAAYEGLVNHQGDCFVYYGTARALLTNAGIKNMEIHKIPNPNDNTRHTWNLVDIGEGWYHFDTTPRRAGGEFCYISDAALMAYSNAHDLSHNYDRAQYPNIQ